MSCRVEKTQNRILRRKRSIFFKEVYDMKRMSGLIMGMFKGCPKPNGWFAGNIATDENNLDNQIVVVGITRLPLKRYTKIIFDAEEKMHNGRVQYEATNIELDLTHTKTISTFLMNGIAPELTQDQVVQIVTKFKSKTVDVILEQPYELTQFGISKKVAQEIRIEILKRNLKGEILKIMPKLSDEIIEKIVAKYAEKAIDTIKDNPYILNMEFGVEFKDVDKTALQMGIKDDAKCRIHGCIYNQHYKMTNYTADSFIELSNDRVWMQLCNKVAEYINLPHINTNVISKEIPQIPYLKISMIEKKCLLYNNHVYEAETNCVKQIKSLISQEPLTNNRSGIDTTKRINQQYTATELIIKNPYLNKLIDEYESKTKIELDREQRLAVLQAIINRISIINGKAGSGKTTVIKCILYLWEKTKTSNTIPIMAAPTGKAVQRIRESVNIPEYQYNTIAYYTYRYENDNNTINMFENTIVIVDETSMLGIEDASKFLKLCQDSQIIFIGDTNQLPSIAVGSFFKDIIDYDKIPTTTLTISHRSESQNILNNADKINTGCQLKDLKVDAESFMIYPYDIDDENMVNNIINIYKTHLADGADFTEMTILSPMRKFTTGSNNLNIMLQNLLNPVQDGVQVIENNEVKYKKRGFAIGGTTQYGVNDEKTTLRIGDRVMCTQNTNDVLIVNNKGEEMRGCIANGECGTIIEYIERKNQNGEPDNQMIIKTDDNNKVYISYDNFGKIILAYAMTIHKSQGNEYRHVILVMQNALNRLPKSMNFATRNLIYTAITRARNTLEIVGSVTALNDCIKTTLNPRNSLLRYRLETCNG